MSSVALRSSTRVCSSIFARFASSSRFFSSAPSAETPSPQTAVVSKRQTRLGKNLRPSNIGDAEWDSQADYDIVRLTESNKHMPTVKELVAMGAFFCTCSSYPCLQIALFCSPLMMGQYPRHIMAKMFDACLISCSTSQPFEIYGPLCWVELGW